MSPDRHEDPHEDPIVDLRRLLMEFDRREGGAGPRVKAVLWEIVTFCLGRVLDLSIVDMRDEYAVDSSLNDVRTPWLGSTDPRLGYLHGAYGRLLKDARELDSKIESARKKTESKDEDALASEAGAFFDDIAGWLLQLADVSGSIEPAPNSLLARRFAVEVMAAADRLRFDELLDFRPNGPQDWFPLVSHSPPPQNSLTIPSWIDQQNLVDRLDGGTNGRGLIPFLGPGVIQARADPPEMIEDPSSLFGDDAPLDRDFLDALVAQRRGRRDLSAEGWCEVQGLAELRRALISSARLGTTVVSCCERILPIADWDRYEVPLDGALLSNFKSTLSTAATAAASLAERNDAHEPDPDLGLLGAAAIAVRLQRLVGELGPDGGPSTVMGSVVNWLTDCAWHSLVFRSATYPTVRELTMQVELCAAAAGVGPVRRLEPSEAFAHRTLSSLPDHTTHAVLRGFRRSAGVAGESRGHLHNVIAQRLWQESTKRIARPPLAVSMTFDLEMERALLESRPKGCDFHVLVPALIAQAGERISLRWLLGTYSDDSCHGSDILGVLRTPSWRVGELAPLGPVVVKLNGSPLHRLPRIGESRTKALPAMLLRELDSLDIGSVGLVANALQRSSATTQLRLSSRNEDTPAKDTPAPSQAMPSWVLSRIAPASEDSSLLLVIGARWSDWSSRSQLFGLLSLPGTNSDRRFAHRAFAVAMSVDPDRVHLLDWLLVQLVMGDCLELIPHIEMLVQ